MKISCDIDYGEVENEEGFMTPTTTATCSRCHHETESYGDSDRSVRRCLVMLYEECPRSEDNFYEES